MRVVDLFAGCGGMSKGFQNAGYDIVAAFELWDSAVECYKMNFSHPVYQKDLSKVNEVSEIIKSINPDMIIGGPPCQDFSHAGRRTEGDKASLTADFADIIVNVHPVWFVMENVDRVQNSQAYAYAREKFKEAGYGLTERVLDASLCGVPQKRKRFFCIGSLHDTDNFADTLIDSRLSSKPMTVRDYFGDELGIEYYYRHPRNYNRRGIFSIDEPAPTVRGVNRPVPKGYLGHPLDAAPVSSDIRPLTTYERALIQTFPVDYVWVGSKTDVEQMVGNAVPVKLAEFVAKIVADYSVEKLQLAVERSHV
ncbi:MAG: DNA cytosine methyltransferase [Alicyclobacillus herbarius]|uniref:DNA cytosine methyltransferase n=1 Tax=Alicyclobacillus herbarius TaxID=122960 RepID=UPI0023540CB2|nr:DNA cytosine methyltransferase [Alicyclobacillus herbarius]MCL6633107.1 DNA cytosine methyltransferase [Alicyclobacillus herbarius]